MGVCHADATAPLINRTHMLLPSSVWSRVVFGTVLALCVLATSGCGTFRSYREEMDATLGQVSAGNLPGAITLLEKNNKGDKKDLLYYMELGELRRLANEFPASFAAFRDADKQILAWEQASVLNASKAGGSIGSYLINDKLRVYEGEDFEKVMVTTRLAMDHLAGGDYDNARVEIKRTHEREAFIGAVRAKEYVAVTEEARKKGAKQNFKEINGYPVQTIDSPEVAALKNSYQNALSHYLAGFVYESLGEPSLAAPGYRTAIELRPGQSMLEDSLGGLDDRVAAPDDGKCDTLFVIETGQIPGRINKGFNLPIPVGPTGEWILISVSFPVLPPRAPYDAPRVGIDQTLDLRTAHILDLDTMARRSLKDQMPGLMLRGFARVATRAVAQYQMQKQMEQQRSKSEDTLGLGLALLALQIGGAITESADERGWRSLPAQVTVARGRLSLGQHSVEIANGGGTARFDVNLTGPRALVSVRLAGGRSFVSPVGTPGGSVPIGKAQSADRGDDRNDPVVVVTNFDLPLQSQTERRMAQ